MEQALRSFDDLRLGTKLGLLVGLVLSGLLCACFAGAWLVQREMMTGRIDELRAIADTGRGIAAGLQQQVECGEMSRPDAEDALSRRLRSMRYNDGQGYVFAYRMDGTAVAVPNPDQMGKNQIDLVVNGRAVIREIRDAVKAEGSAVIRYDFPHPGTTAAAAKVSYAVAFPEWDLFIGTGAYVDDLEARFRPILWSMLGGVVLMVVVIVGAAVLITRRITRPLTELRRAMDALAAGDIGGEVPCVARRDEIGAMAGTVQVFRAAAIEKLRLEADALAAGRLTEAERTRVAAHLAAVAADQSRVVAAVATGLARLAGGDLAYRIDADFPADSARLRIDFNDAMSKLQDTMRTVAASAATITSGTTEISAASNDLSRRTEQQAASLEETAAALDEITATVRRTAEGSKRARAVVGHARGNAEQSGRIVRQAVEAMSSIEKSSAQITQIIGVIDEIAFQTNLLALNAGVEAARAGDAGRGFAVVASEVRALAQRSADAAKEIKALILTSGRQVEDGVAFVGQTGEALARIVAEVTEIDGIVSEIAASAQEQASGLDEVNVALNQMDQVTQQNAAMVEEATAAGQSLAAETGELARLIARFEVGDLKRHGAHRPPGRPALAGRASSTVTALRVVGPGSAAHRSEATDEDWTTF